MAQNILGDVRRSNCIGTHGPGAIAEFREQHGAAISGVCCGLDDWPAGTQRIYERRLQCVLGKQEFRLPPVDPKGGLHLAARRFPDWQHCPVCGRVRPASEWGNAGPGEPALICPDHPIANGKPVYVAPVRFVVTCDFGHLQDFPWEHWIRHAKGCRAPILTLKQTSVAGLAGLVLSCETCGEKRSFENAFQRNAITDITGCHGHAQWLGPSVRVPNCQRVPRVVQRGASNLYFPVTMSALAIPPFTEPLQAALNPYWQNFLENDETEWPLLIRMLRLTEKLGSTAEEILAAAKRSRDALGANNTKALRHEEFMKFESGVSVPGDADFEIRTEIIPPDLAPFFSGIVRAVRLREVRAQRGFTRLNPPDAEDGGGNMTKLSLAEKNWLPAVEMRGEGIFLRLKETAVKDWEEKREVKDRAERINAAYCANWQERFGAGAVPPRVVDARLILVHTFAHALMRQLTLDCGYSSASLRERLYADKALGMAGVLIYTATTDSDGSLGGLERQGRTARIGAIVNEAIKSMEWCSNDPLCIDDTAMFSERQNLAACHACLLAPETSCEEFNILLDRATLVGRRGLPGLGFFEVMLDPLADL